MKNLKRLFSLLVSLALLMSALPILGEAAVPMEGAVQLGGFVMHDFGGGDDGKFIGFTDADPGEIEIHSFCLTTYAAAYYDGTVYGYVYGFEEDGTPHYEFYTMDTRNNYVMDYPGGGSDGEFVYAMAYNYADNTMYALCDENQPYIAAVDIASGALTRVVDIELGSYLGLMSMAIDAQGNFYVLSMSALNARLLRLDVETGALTEIGATGHPSYYAQSITCDPASGMLYWAHLNTSLDNGLYALDPDTAECTYLGKIGSAGMEIMGLYVVYDAQTEPGFVLGDANGDGEVNVTDALLVLRASMDITELSEIAALAADVDADGAVTASDALRILRYSMGISASL